MGGGGYEADDDKGEWFDVLKYLFCPLYYEHHYHHHNINNKKKNIQENYP